MQNVTRKKSRVSRSKARGKRAAGRERGTQRSKDAKHTTFIQQTGNTDAQRG